MKKCDQIFELDLNYDVIDDVTNIFNTTILIKNRDSVQQIQIILFRNESDAEQ